MPTPPPRPHVKPIVPVFSCCEKILRTSVLWLQTPLFYRKIGSFCTSVISFVHRIFWTKQSCVSGKKLWLWTTGFSASENWLIMHQIHKWNADWAGSSSMDTARIFSSSTWLTRWFLCLITGLSLLFKRSARLGQSGHGTASQRRCTTEQVRSNYRSFVSVSFITLNTLNCVKRIGYIVRCNLRAV